MLGADLYTVIAETGGTADSQWLATAMTVSQRVVVVMNAYYVAYGGWGGRPIPGRAWLETEIHAPSSPSMNAGESWKEEDSPTQPCE